MECINKVEHLDDRVRIHYQLKKPEGIPHVNGTEEVLYSAIPNLPREPELPENHGPWNSYREYWDESVFVEKIGKIIVYHFTEGQETARSREQDFEGGPYLRD